MFNLDDKLNDKYTHLYIVEVFIGINWIYVYMHLPWSSY